MSFSKKWENQYRENSHMSIWPWTDLVSYVMRYARPNNEDFSICELGCGAGANIPFFLNLKVNYYGVDGSQSIIQKLKERFPILKDRLIVTDFTKEIPFDKQFDLIIDRASLTHNSTNSIKRSVELINNKLKPGGKFIGIDWFSTHHFEFKRGSDGLDANTRANYVSGQFSNLGPVHFSDREHLEDILKNFILEKLEHKIIQRIIPEDGDFASWNFVARKK